MIRVLHVIGAMDMGGAETILMEIYRNIDKNLFQFDFAVHTDKKCLYDDEIESIGGKIYRFKKFNGLNYISYKRQWKKFFRNHREFDIIHGHIGSSSAIYLKVARNNGIKAIAHSHATNNKKSGISIHGLIWKLYSFPTRYIANYYLACSINAGIDRFGKKIIISDKFSVLNNGINPYKFKYNNDYRKEIRNQFNIKENDFVIGNVGRLVEEKNHKFLIEIFSKIHENIKNSKLVIVGDGYLKNELKKEVEKFSLNEFVIFASTRSDAYKFFSSFDVFVFPSISEGLGISAIEAQASGLKVICSDALPLEAKVSDNLIFVSLKKNSSFWANVIVSNKNCTDRETAYNVIKKNKYDINSSVKKLGEIYQQLMKE